MQLLGRRICWFAAFTALILGACSTGGQHRASGLSGEGQELTVTVVDSMGTVSNVAVAMPRATEPDLSEGRDIAVERSADGATLRVVWYGSPCDDEVDISVELAGDALLVSVNEGPIVECDGIAVRYVAVLSLGEPAPSGVDGAISGR